MPATMPTLKPLTTPIRFIEIRVHVQALMTGLRGMAGVNAVDFHPYSQSLVLDKQPKLVERPTVATSAVRLVAGPLIGTLSNSRQILQRNADRKRFRSFNDTFRNIVIYPTLKATLTTRQPLQQLTASPSRTACALTGFVLELGSQVGTMVTDFGYVLSIPALPFRCVGNICTPQVHSQNLISILRLWRLRLQANLDVVGTILPFEQSCRLGIRACQHPSLVVADCQCKSLTAINSSERNRPILLSEGEDPSVIGDKASLERFYWTVFLSGEPTKTRYSPAYLLSQIARQAEPGANLVITEGLQLNCIDYLFWRVLVHPVQRLHKSIQCRIQFDGLRRGYLEPARDSQDLIHNPIISHQKKDACMLDGLLSGSVPTPERGAPAKLAEDLEFRVNLQI